MKTFESITGFKPHTYKGRIITFGLTESENNFLKILFHSKDIEIYDADIASDLVALFATAKRTFHREILHLSIIIL